MDFGSSDFQQTIIGEAVNQAVVQMTSELVADAPKLVARTITVEGVSSLKGTDYAVICDRIEAGTYAVAGAMAGGEVRLTKVRPELIAILLDKLVEQVRELNGGDLDDDMAMLALGFPDLADR